MSERDYHDAMVEAGNEAIEQGRAILAGNRNEHTACAEHKVVTPKQRTLGDILREATERRLGQ